MEKVARFLKVSPEQFLNDGEKNLKGVNLSEAYNDISLPKRATIGSAGYDFFSPVDFTLARGEEITIPTGIRSEIKNGYVQYEDIDVYYDKENKIEFRQGWVHSERLYPFLCFIVQGLKKKK